MPTKRASERINPMSRTLVKNITQLVASIKSSFYYENILTAFLDISSAYDNIQYSIFLNK